VPNFRSRWMVYKILPLVIQTFLDNITFELTIQSEKIYILTKGLHLHTLCHIFKKINSKLTSLILVRISIALLKRNCPLRVNCTRFWFWLVMNNEIDYCWSPNQNSICFWFEKFSFGRREKKCKFQTNSMQTIGVNIDRLLMPHEKLLPSFCTNQFYKKK